MADTTIGALPNLADISDDALLVVEFQGTAYSITGAQWKAYAVAAAAGVNKGDPGKDGVSPTVAVEDITGGHRVIFTDAKGTQTVDVMNGVAGTSPSLSVETIENGHRITITDATGTKSFDVLNGADGDGSGDMLKNDYDADGTVKIAGGIAAYVDAQVGEAVEASY